jgi:hypothetical protein
VKPSTPQLASSLLRKVAQYSKRGEIILAVFFFPTAYFDAFNASG